MSLELVPFSTVKQGLVIFLDNAYTMAQNMRARHDTPILSDNTDLWSSFLDSKTMQLYGGLNEEGRTRFKIDNAPDLVSIVNESISSDGSISINEKLYNGSRGTEFIAVLKKDVKQGQADYAIRADKYQAVREQLKSGTLNVNDFVKAGGFKVNVRLTPEEVENSDGWNMQSEEMAQLQKIMRKLQNY